MVITERVGLGLKSALTILISVIKPYPFLCDVLSYLCLLRSSVFVKRL